MNRCSALNPLPASVQSLLRPSFSPPTPPSPPLPPLPYSAIGFCSLSLPQHLLSHTLLDTQYTVSISQTALTPGQTSLGGRIRRIIHLYQRGENSLLTSTPTFTSLYYLVESSNPPAASQVRGREAVLAALSDVITVSDAPPAQQSRERYEPSFSYSGAQPMRAADPPRMVPAPNPFENETLPPPPPPAKSGMAGKFANAFRKQTAEEKEAKRRAKEARMQEEISKSSAKTTRMDVIDRLDLSGINGASMFHHDSPYDACAPHMNRGKRAPVRAFDPNIDPMTGLPYNRGPNGARKPNNNFGPAPRKGDLEDDDDKTGASGSRPSLSTNGSRPGRGTSAPLVPSLPMNADASATQLSLATDESGDNDERWRAQQGYHTQPSNVPESRYDSSNPNADVWGVSAEPWQDFAQPKQREKTGNRSMLSPYAAGGHYGDRSGTTSAASSVFDMEAVMTGKKSGAARGDDDLAIGSASPFPEPDWSDRQAAGDGPKRNKSIIKRIKSMRENPNVPASDENVELGAMGGRRRRAAAHRHSPSTPPMRQDGAGGNLSSSRAAADAAVGMQPSATYGDFERTTPRGEPQQAGYFNDNQAAGGRVARSPGGEGGAGLGRSGSIFNKWKRGGQKASKSSEREAAYA